jgi:hypothetical protein
MKEIGRLIWWRVISANLWLLGAVTGLLGRAAEDSLHEVQPEGCEAANLPRERHVAARLTVPVSRLFTARMEPRLQAFPNGERHASFETAGEYRLGCMGRFDWGLRRFSNPVRIRANALV